MFFCDYFPTLNSHPVLYFENLETTPATSLTDQDTGGHGRGRSDSYSEPVSTELVPGLWSPSRFPPPPLPALLCSVIYFFPTTLENIDDFLHLYHVSVTFIT